MPPNCPTSGVHLRLPGAARGYPLPLRRAPVVVVSGAATAAHIHSAPRGVAGPVTVPLCTQCTSPVSGTVVLTADQMKDLLAGKQYVNVHTAKNAGGEIRGQITKAPTK